MGLSKDVPKDKKKKTNAKKDKKNRSPIRGRAAKLSKDKGGKPGDSIYSAQSKVSEKMDRGDLPQVTSVPLPPKISKRKPTPHAICLTREITW